MIDPKCEQFTTAMRAPLLRARRRKFGQNSVSAITISSRLQRGQIGPDGEPEVQRKVEDAFFSEALFGQLLAGGRGG